MTDSAKKTGSQMLLERFVTNNESSSVAAEKLENWLQSFPTNKHLYDARYEQIELNVRIIEAMVDGLGGDHDKQKDSVQKAIEELRAQVRNLGSFAERGILGTDVEENGSTNEG